MIPRRHPLAGLQALALLGAVAGSTTELPPEYRLEPEPSEPPMTLGDHERLMKAHAKRARKPA